MDEVEVLKQKIKELESQLQETNAKLNEILKKGEHNARH